MGTALSEYFSHRSSIGLLLPYSSIQVTPRESDHVLNIAYNTLTGGTCLEDIELRRNDEALMDGVGVERIPDPTTAGDFTRRFSEEDVAELMEAINSIRPRLWKKRLAWNEREEAILDADGTHALTWGECKEGIGLSYDGDWCYHPLLIFVYPYRGPGLIPAKRRKP